MECRLAAATIGAGALVMAAASEHQVVKEDIGGHGGVSEGGDERA